MVNNNLVSIITPCYNSAKFIQETAKSVLAQTYANWEWIITDDCSSDDSIRIIQELSTQDQRIKLIQLHKNSGAAVARNQSLAKAKGRYITFLDSDDLWMTDFLEQSVNFLVQNKETLVYASYKRLNEQLQPFLSDFIAYDYVKYKDVVKSCPIPMLTAMYDSKTIGKVYFPLVDKREDYAHWLLILKKTKHARAIRKPLGIYRIRQNSYSRNKKEIAVKTFLMYKNFLKYSYPKAFYCTLVWAFNSFLKYRS